MTIDFNNNTLNYKDKNFLLGLNENNEITLQPGINIIELPIKQQNLQRGLLNNFITEDYNIREGLYSI